MLATVMPSSAVDHEPGTVAHSGSGQRPTLAAPSDPAKYHAILDHTPLPPAQNGPGMSVLRGAAVDVGHHWAFFDDLATAAGFARAGHMSNMAPSWDLFEAAEIRAYCQAHARDELTLLLGRQVYERAEMYQLIKRFAVSAAGDAAALS
ncbi:hypothetical protein [Promicromonospora sp. NPDC059942]|uniref:hypothetical protein n=1 Tax=Promicromonospora sp. NPDC059942 TaxID=3347009 RepID=UPI0036686842